MFNVINRNSRKRCEICSMLTIKTLERRQRRSGVFIVNFNIFTTCSTVTIVNFEQVNVAWNDNDLIFMTKKCLVFFLLGDVLIFSSELLRLVKTNTRVPSPLNSEESFSLKTRQKAMLLAQNSDALRCPKLVCPERRTFIKLLSLLQKNLQIQ